MTFYDRFTKFQELTNYEKNKKINIELKELRNETNMQLSKMKFLTTIDLSLLTLISSNFFYINKDEILDKIVNERFINMFCYSGAIFSLVVSLLICVAFLSSPSNKSDNYHIGSIRINSVNFLKKLQKNEKLAAIFFSFGIGFIIYLLLLGVGLVG